MITDRPYPRARASAQLVTFDGQRRVIIAATLVIIWCVLSLGLLAVLVGVTLLRLPV